MKRPGTHVQINQFLTVYPRFDATTRLNMTAVFDLSPNDITVEKDIDVLFYGRVIENNGHDKIFSMHKFLSSNSSVFG